MPEPRALRASKGVSVCIYGVPGAGKTRLIGSGPKTLIIRPPTDHTDSIEDGADVEEIVVADWQDLNETFEWGHGGGFKKYDWVWFDSISLFQDHGLDDVFQAAIDRKPERSKFGPDKGEFGINMGRIQKFVRDMVGLSDSGLFNFGIVAHPFEWYDPVQQEDVWAPFIQGKNMSPKICGYMNIVAYLAETRKKGEVIQRTLLTDAEGHVGKDQFYCFPELKSGRHGIVDPTMPKLIKAINTRKKGSSRTTTRRRKKRQGGSK